MAISTVSQKGLDAPLTLTSPVLNSPVISGTPTGTLVSANMPTGSVLQVVSQTFTAGFTTTSTTLQDTGYSLSITPKFSTSKVFVLATPLLFITNSTGQNYVYGGAAVYRGATFLQEKGTSVNSGTSAFVDQSTTLTLSYLDSPATTSSTAYKIYIRSITSAFATQIGWSGWPTQITLMEIAG